MCRRAGVLAGGAESGAGAPPRARRALRRGQCRPGGCRAAGPGAGLPAADADVRRADRARRRRHRLAAPGCRDLPAAAVLPRLWPHPEQRPIRAGLAVSAGGGAGEWADELDGDPGRHPAGPGRGCHRGHRRPAARGDRAAARGRALVARGSADAGGARRRLRRAPAGLSAGRSADPADRADPRRPGPVHRRGSTPARRATGRPRRHGAVMTLADPASWPAPSTRSASDTARYGRAQVLSWDRMHPRLTHRGAWAAHPGRLPIVAGTLIRLQVDHLPGARAAKPIWLWTSALDADVAAVTRCWQAYLRRFDLEHTIRFAKQVLGWTRPRLRCPAAADRWTWLILAAHTELRLARPLAADLRRPWERPLPAERLTPARVRRGFRYLRAKTPSPASAPKPAHPGPGRPSGVNNRQRAPRYDVGKTTIRTPTISTEQVKG